MLNNISQLNQLLKAQLIPLATIGTLTFALTIVMVVEKFSAEVEEIAIQQVRAPAKINFNWFGAKAVVQEEVDMSNMMNCLLPILMPDCWVLLLPVTSHLQR